MTWIGARLHDLRDADAKCHARSETEPTPCDSPAPKPNSIQAGIIDTWKTAVDLLRYAAAKHIYCRMDYFRCDICQQAAQSAPAICHESYCFVGKLRAHIAKMEGTEHGRD